MVGDGRECTMRTDLAVFCGVVLAVGAGCRAPEPVKAPVLDAATETFFCETGQAFYYCVSGFYPGTSTMCPPLLKRVTRNKTMSVSWGKDAEKALAAEKGLRAAPPPPGVAVVAESSIPNGLLGHRLGTYLTIEGVRATTGPYIRTLLVDTVNGKKLDAPIPMWVENAKYPGLPEKERCIIRGYETGQMIGAPDEVLRAEKLPAPQAGWRVHRYFIITSVVQPASLQGEVPQRLMESVTAWVGVCIARTEALKPGMTRKDLLRVYATEGGLSHRTRRTYVYSECPYFKIDVEFKPSGPGEEEQPTDVIVKISQPYLQLSISD
jgi:hypothetical protein